MKAAAMVAASTSPAPPTRTVDRMQTKEFTRQLKKDELYFRFSKSQMDGAMEDLRRVSGSGLLKDVREAGFVKRFPNPGGDITIALAESYGFCWGVERSVAMAYEALNFFPGSRIWLTNEIIHNPIVNRTLAEKGVRFIEKKADGKKDYSVISEGDVVMLPAFGATVDEMALLQDRKARIVDTTCPWVSKVWTSVEKSKSAGHTAIIHGTFDHEETIATSSFAAKYLVLRNMEDAEYVAGYIVNGGDRKEFLRRFQKKMSDGFDPDKDLVRVGVANQTTMLKGETELIGKLFERAMIKKYGPQAIDHHFLSFNTICDATDDRQNAMYDMLGIEYERPSSALYTELQDEQPEIGLKTQGTRSGALSSKKMEAKSRGGSEAAGRAKAPKLDLCLVVGGYNSSNTVHLLEIALEAGVPAYHIDGPDRVGGPTGAKNLLTGHKPLATIPNDATEERGLAEAPNFLPKGPVVIGVTSGASTPDVIVEEVLQKVLAIKQDMAMAAA